MRYINFKLKLAILVVLSTISSIVSVLFPLSLMKITDAITKSNTHEFYLNIGIGIIIISLQMILYYICERVQNKYIKDNIIMIRSNIVESLLSMTYDKFKSKKKSEYTSILLNDIKTLEIDFYISILSLISKGLLLVSALVGLYIINPVFLIIVVSIIIFISILPVIFSKNILKHRERYMTSNESFTEIINECLDGFETIKSYNIINKILNIHKERAKKFEGSNENMKNTVALANVIFGTATMIISLSIFTIGGYLAINNNVTIGGLIASIQLLMYIIEPTITIAENYNNVNSTKPIRDRINNICYYEIQNTFNFKDNNIKQVNDIVLEKLSYKYKDGFDYILKDISFTFEAGKKYAIIGENGSGKSTLLKVIGNLITDYEGRISINSSSYKDLDPKDLFDKISFVHQDNFLFNSSIRDNILLFDNEVNKDEDIELLINLLYLNDSIKSYINNSDYTVGYNGEHLSGGEKQKISLIRALLRHKGVLLLDEASSALDLNSTNQVGEIINNMKNTLSIVVTHKIDDSLRHFDNIIVMEKGEIINCVRYEDLELEELNLLTSY